MEKTNENNNVNVNEEVTEDYRETEEETVEAEKKEQPKKTSFGHKVKKMVTSKPVKIVGACVVGALGIYVAYKGVGYFKNAKYIADAGKHAEHAAKRIHNEHHHQIEDLSQKVETEVPKYTDTDIPIDVPAQEVNNVADDVVKTVEETVTE